MAKELPYFRFTVQDWQNGKISLESYELQGLFISVCGYYWINNCDITLATLKKRFSNATAMLDQLIELGIMKHEDRHDKVKIDFLLTQLCELSEIRKRRQDAGSKGGNAKAKLQQKGSYKDNNKDNNKEKIDRRKLAFSETLKPFLDKYGKELLNEFYKYWTEPNKSMTKLRWEMERAWDLERRLETWAKRDKNFNPTPEEKNKIAW